MIQKRFLKKNKKKIVKKWKFWRQSKEKAATPTFTFNSPKSNF